MATPPEQRLTYYYYSFCQWQRHKDVSIYLVSMAIFTLETRQDRRLGNNNHNQQQGTETTNKQVPKSEQKHSFAPWQWHRRRCFNKMRKVTHTISIGINGQQPATCDKKCVENGRRRIVIATDKCVHYYFPNFIFRWARKKNCEAVAEGGAVCNTAYVCVYM